MFPKKFSRRDGPYLTETQLSKKVVAGLVVYYFLNPVFPDYIFVALDDCSACGRGDVVNLLDFDETPLEFTPLARIDELVLNIPSREEFFDYFKNQHGITDPDEITMKLQMEFWDNFVWGFATEVKGIKIEWSR